LFMETGWKPVLRSSMTWIKRNLYFLILSVVGLVLLGGAGWYLYSQWKLNNDILSQLGEQYAELDRLAKETPHPGTPDGKVDNIKLAKEQQQQLREFIAKARKYFQPIPRIPDEPKVIGSDFSSALRRTVDQLQHDAANTSVTLQPKYLFSFAAEYNSVVFAPGSLEPLSMQLGEVKEICEVLFQAKVNSLDGLARERISADDLQGPQPDYIEDHSVTNELAVLTPYQITFKCFSPELAAVLSGLSSSPHCFLVKAINVSQSPAAAATVAEATTQPMPIYQPPPPTQMPNPDSEYARRYATPDNPYGRPTNPYERPGYPTPGYPTPGYPARV
jgi:hypothetical protein